MPQKVGLVVSMVAQCQCVQCQQADEVSDRALHRRMNLLLSRLDEAQRRWYVALESERIGYGGDRLLAQITGMTETTIRRGRAELEADLAAGPAAGVRQPGAGRPLVEKKIRP